MSRSRRKTPIIGITTSASEKRFKASAHRAERRNVRARLPTLLDGDDRRLHAKVYGDPWGGPKDGKTYWPDRRVMRK